MKVPTFIESRLLQWLALLMIVVIAVSVLFSWLTDKTWPQGLAQNLPSEMVGAAVGVLVTVFVVNQLLTRHETARWRSVRVKVMAQIMSSVSWALFSLNTWLKFESEQNLIDSIAKDIASRLPNGEPAFSEFANRIPLAEMPGGIEAARPHVEQLQRLIDTFHYVLADEPKLVELRQRLEHAFVTLEQTMGLLQIPGVTIRAKEPGKDDYGPPSRLIAVRLLSVLFVLGEFYEFASRRAAAEI